MGSLKADEDDTKELDDSGYVQDEGTLKASPEKKKAVCLLDLSDDVLLCILKHCQPADLKALGFTCTRLASVTLDRTLWQRVDARARCAGARRLRWLLAHALHAGTTQLLLRGYADETQNCTGYHYENRPTCLGGTKGDHNTDKPQRRCCPGLTDRMYPDISRVTLLWPEEELERTRVAPSKTEPDSNKTKQFSKSEVSASNPGSSRDIKSTGSNSEDIEPDLGRTETDSRDGSIAKRQKIDTESGTEGHPSEVSSRGSVCPGPRFTVTPCLLQQLRAHCNLTTLALDYCNINCAKISLSNFPRQLTHLSLRGTMCYNMNMNKNMLFQIQEHLPDIEHLDLSECGWVEASCLMPLSKLERLRALLLARCVRMRECVAYAAISARYGFRRLKVFDLRGSPLGDSETAALGWMPELEELYLSAPRAQPAAPGHKHYADDQLPYVEELSDWEIQEPEYFKSLLKQKKRSKKKTDENGRCCHGVPFTQCADGLGGVPANKTRDLKRSAFSSEDAGPSKRRRSSVNLDSDDDASSVEDKNESTNADNRETNEEEHENGENAEAEANGGNEEGNRNQIIELRPRAHVLYVNLGQRLNPVVHRIVNLNQPNDRGIPAFPRRINFSELVTDTAIRSFGHTDDDHLNCFYIGAPPQGPGQQNYSRPDKSSLRILSMVGYKNITDKSLEHLRTSAPKLEKIDFSQTGVTKRGVDMFNLSRPNVEIVYSPFVKAD